MMRRARVGGPQLKEQIHQKGAIIYYCYKRWACNPFINRSLYKWGDSNPYIRRVTTTVTHTKCSGRGPSCLDRSCHNSDQVIIQVAWVLAGVHLCCKHLRSSRILGFCLGKKYTKIPGMKGKSQLYIYIFIQIHGLYYVILLLSSLYISSSPRVTTVDLQSRESI